MIKMGKKAKTKRSREEILFKMICLVDEKIKIVDKKLDDFMKIIVEYLEGRA